VTTNLYVGRGYSGPNAYGFVDFSGSEGGFLEVAKVLNIGTASKGRGYVMLGRNWRVAIGSPAFPATSLDIGNSSSPGFCTGIVAFAEGGSFSAVVQKANIGYQNSACDLLGLLDMRAITGSVSITVLDTLRIGRRYSNVQVRGIVDCGNAEDVSLDVKTLLVCDGASPNYGEFRIGRGQGRADTVTLGNGSAVDPATNLGLLDLNGMALSVTNRITLNRSGAVRATIRGASSGLFIENPDPAALQVNSLATLAAGAGVRFVFHDPDKSRYLPRARATPETPVYWGLKWSGDHVAFLQDLVSKGQLDIALELTDLHVPDLEEMIFFAPEDGDTGATYIGFHTRPVHAETIMMVR
jgi:hypothetical protein